MAGVTNPTIISGIIKPRNWENTLPNVAISLAHHMGATTPTPMPAAIATIIHPSSPIFNFFMVQVYYMSGVGARGNQCGFPRPACLRISRVLAASLWSCALRASTEGKARSERMRRTKRRESVAP